MTPLFYKGEVVKYNSDSIEIVCVVLEAYHYGRDVYNLGYRERYIIQSMEPEVYSFDHELEEDGIVYHNVNKCAGEYLKKIDTKNPLYSFDIESMFEEFYKNQTPISNFNSNEYR